MPLSHIKIEEEKKWTIGLLFLILIGLYFLTAWVLGNIVKIFIYIGYFYKGNISHPYLNSEETIYVLGIGLLAGTIHWYISLKDATLKMLRILNAQPLDLKDSYHQRLRNIVEEVRSATGGQKVRCVVIPCTSMNAFAIMDFENEPVVGVTEGLLSKLNRRQLQAVIGHEMAHIVSGDCFMTTISCSLFGLYSEMMKGIEMAFKMAKEAGYRKAEGGIIVFTLIYVVLAITRALNSLIEMVISREREYRADAVAVRLTSDPLALTEALYAISRNYRGLGAGLSSIFIISPKNSLLDEKEGFWADLFSTHPPVKKRLKILLNMARINLEALENQMEKEKKLKIRKDTRITLAQPPSLKESWFVCDEKNGNWIGPFPLSELSQLKWFRPETWVKQEGGDKVTLAYKNKRLMEMFKEDLKEKKVSKFLCPHCQVELVEILYEGAPILQCNYCQGLFLEEKKVNRIISRKDQAFTEEAIRLAVLYDPRLRKKMGIGEFEEMKPKFSFLCPSCKKEMTRRGYSIVYPVEIDFCKSCNYIWFDKSELEVLQYLIEQTAQKEIYE